MQKTVKRWLIAATVLVLIGLAGLVVLLAANSWDVTKLDTAAFETNTYDLDEAFDKIFVDTDTADVVIMQSQSDACKVVCRETENVKHTVTVRDGTLTIRTNDEREWYEHIGLSFGSVKITVYLPQKDYEALCITTTTGDVKVSDISFGEMEIEVTTGDVILEHVLTERIMSIRLTTGDVQLDSCDAGEIFIKTSTGDVWGRLLSEKIFTAKSSTGDVRVPKTSTGGKCEIRTSTGDIQVEIAKD